MDCNTGGLFSYVANGVSGGFSDMLPIVMLAAKATVIALVALVPAFVFLVLAGKDESRKLVGERRGVYRPRQPRGPAPD